MASAPRTLLDFGYESDLAVRGKVIRKIDELMKETVYQDEVAGFIEDFWLPYFTDAEDIRALRADENARAGLERQIPLAIRNALLIDELFPADYFLEHEPDRFTPAERAFLRRFIDARITFIQLREFFPEAGYTLAEDIFDGREYTIFDKAFSQSGSPHAIVSARLVELPDGRGHVLEQVGLGVFFPEDKEVIVAALEHEARGYWDGEWTKDPDSKVPPEALHGMLHDDPMFVYGIEILMASRNLNAIRPRLANTDGEPLIQIEARYRCEDPDALRAALRAQPNIDHQALDGADFFAWTNRKDTLIGSARLYAESKELVAETNSRPRHRKWEKKLQSLGALTLLEKRETPIDFESIQEGAMDMRAAAGKKGVREGGGSGEPTNAEWEAALPQIRAQLAERWLKERIPMLDGKTPLQAAKTESGRKQLRELFAYIESQQARMPSDTEAGWDVDEMKRRLGLPES